MAEEKKPAVPAVPPRRSVVHWCERKRTPAWLFAAAAAGNRWETSAQVQATEVTEAAYDAAITQAAGRQ